MLFIVGLSHVITTSTARVPVSFQLSLSSKCPPLASTHARRLVKVICFSQGTVATFYRWGWYIYNHLMWRFFGIQYTKNY